MNNPNHISESLETIFLGYNTDADSGWEKFGSEMENIRIPYP